MKAVEFRCTVTGNGQIAIPRKSRGSLLLEYHLRVVLPQPFLITTDWDGARPGARYLYSLQQVACCPIQSC